MRHQSGYHAFAARILRTLRKNSLFEKKVSNFNFRIFQFYNRFFWRTEKTYARIIGFFRRRKWRDFKSRNGFFIKKNFELVEFLERRSPFFTLFLNKWLNPPGSHRKLCPLRILEKRSMKISNWIQFYSFHVKILH